MTPVNGRPPRLPPRASARQVAAYLGMRGDRVRELARTGMFGNAYQVKPGPKSRWRIPREGVLAWEALNASRVIE